MITNIIQCNSDTGGLVFVLIKPYERVANQLHLNSRHWSRSIPVAASWIDNNRDESFNQFRLQLIY